MLYAEYFVYISGCSIRRVTYVAMLVFVLRVVSLLIRHVGVYAQCSVIVYVECWRLCCV